MNTKILAYTAIATSLLITACVKKEDAKEEKAHKEPVASVENQIPKNQQVATNPSDTTTTVTAPNDNTTPEGEVDSRITLQAELGSNDAVAAPPPRPEARPAPRSEPRPEPRPTPRAETQPKLVETTSTETTQTTSATSSTATETTKATTPKAEVPANSDTPRAKPAPITDKADQQQSIDDAIKQAIDAATPAK